jgi:hypothetical protein
MRAKNLGDKRERFTALMLRPHRWARKKGMLLGGAPNPSAGYPATAGLRGVPVGGALRGTGEVQKPAAARRASCRRKL